MRWDLQYVLDTLRAHEAELRRLGVAHAAVFGSVARGEQRAESDIDVLVELDENRPMGIFEYARLKLYINELLDGQPDAHAYFGRMKRENREGPAVMGERTPLEELATADVVAGLAADTVTFVDTRSNTEAAGRGLGDRKGR